MGVEAAGQFMNSPPSITSTAVSGAKGGVAEGKAFVDFSTGQFNFGASSLTPLFLIAGGAFVLYAILKKK